MAVRKTKKTTRKARKAPARKMTERKVSAASIAKRKSQRVSKPKTPPAPGTPQPPMVLQNEDPSHAPGHRRLHFAKELDSQPGMMAKMVAGKDRFSKGDRVRIMRSNQRRQMNGRR